MKKCIFLDRDGVINKNFVDYVYSKEKLFILPGVFLAVTELKKQDFLLIVITNQSGIAKKIYTKEDMMIVHQQIQHELNYAIDDFYFAPNHPSISESLSRKPDSLMFERAIAKYNINVKESWMIGDFERDLKPAKKLGINTIQVYNTNSSVADYQRENLIDCLPLIFGQ